MIAQNNNNFTRSYGRIKARKLGEGQQYSLSSLLPQVQISEATNWQTLSKPYLKNYLEIGFGSGVHLINTAKHNPDILCLGAEPFNNGIAGCLKQMQNEKLENIRIFPDDARLLLKIMPDNYLSQVDILFPDPWPKKAHHKRRLINADLLNELKRVMRKGAVLNIASDHADYQMWILENMLQSAHFKWDNIKPSECFAPPIGWLNTRYQDKALRNGDIPIFLRYSVL
jgi:tRNA (guanine-N7-)-methyltransferase